MAQQSVRIPYSTHDWTVSGAEPITAFPEAWADVKSPGDGRQYTVGTIEVQYTGVGAEFSEEFAFPVTGASGFDFTLLGVRRQVVMLQCTDASQSIVWQRYFYGTSTEAALRASNARAVAVWPTGIPTTTRIAICGETYDERLPEEGEGLEFAAATATSPTGFIAVLNGAGDLLWTHHVFGSDPSQSCAITDVSIRVEPDGRETVTYCGISSHGDPGAGVPLSPVKPFAPITEDPVTMVPTSSGGDTDHGLFQWDGIVGRVSFVPGEGKGIEFHSIVGGLEQDGLFGLAEIVFEPEGRDRFAVVGATQWASATAPTGQQAFPGLPGISQYYLGTVLFFDAAPTRAGNDLVLESMLPLGAPNSELVAFFTIARDVVVLKDGVFGTQEPGDLLAIAGSTNDPNLPIAGVWDPSPAHSVLQGETDGFLATVADGSITPELWQVALHGGPDRDGLTGVGSWSEFTDQMSVVGFRRVTTPQTVDLDIVVASYHLGFESPVDLSVFGQLRSVRDEVFAGSSIDLPTVMGFVHATNTGLPFLTGPVNEPLLLGEPAGGGIAVDQRARVNAVGQTLSSDYLDLASTPYSVVTPGLPADVPADAIRTVVDMLPFTVGPGIGRTDGSGDPNGFVIAAGFSGGTTPECALSPFGWRIGDSRPELKRMLVDYDGPAPAPGVTDAALIVSRPTAPILPGGGASSVMAAFFQLALPGNTPFVLMPEGIELWVSPANILSPLLVDPNRAWRLPLVFTGTGPLAVQFVCAISVPVTGGLPGGCTPATSFLTASPAIWIPY